jgi:NAD(P)-dependent dehydrogenase (short-subunit alcohol dehydrogenase family)
MQLTGKVVLVTGAQQGIGAAMARKLAAGGADVAINWLDDEGAAQRVADQVCASGRRAILVRADVGQLEQVEAMVSAAQEGLGPIDERFGDPTVPVKRLRRTASRHSRRFSM